MKKSSLVDEYISGFPDDIQGILEQVRHAISEVAPSATEVMSYGIPTFDLNKKHLIHYGAYPHHIGLYPGPPSVAAFEKELKDYKTSKGTIQFPIDKPIPYDLIKKITEFSVDQITK